MKRNLSFTDGEACCIDPSSLHRGLRLLWLVITGLGILIFGLQPFALGCLTQLCVRRTLPGWLAMVLGLAVFGVLWQFAGWRYIYRDAQPSVFLSGSFFLIFYTGGAAWVRGLRERRLGLE